jgi:hypothetical protein
MLYYQLLFCINDWDIVSKYCTLCIMKTSLFSRRMITLYNAELKLMCDEHNMVHHMDKILRLTNHLTEDDFVMLMDAWDDKFRQFMLLLENKISKYMMGHIE